ncbi:MAG TPA: type I polyketide synthase, partial [Solirubrobacterales bacterium]
PRRFALSLAQAHAAGAAVDWGAYFAGSGAQTVKLPTYPFQRERYWLNSSPTIGDVSAAGLSTAGHPLLGAAVELAGAEGLLLTGRLSLDTHPWLADHAVAGTVLLPASVFLALALRAGEQVGAETVEELTMQAPLVLTENGAVVLQVSVSAAGEDDRREISIHARREGEDAEWVAHATGMLSAEPVAAPAPADVWPPEGAVSLEVDYIYDRLAELGVEYGPAFQGLTAAWRDSGHVYAEVSLPEQVVHESGSFAIHPALLDSALQSAMLATLDEQAGPGLGFPFAWRGVGLEAIGAKEARVCLTLDDGALALELADGDGAPLATIGSLAFRPLDSQQMQQPGGGGGDLLGVEWTEVPLEAQDEAPAEVELMHCEIDGSVPVAAAARRAGHDALEAVRQWLAAEPAAESRLALVTDRGVAAGEDECPDPAAAAIWGLIRSAQAEHPGRFALIDSDGSEASRAALAAALAKSSEEPELALREGRALAPRLARLGTAGADAAQIEIDPERTALITGAGSGSGALAARHLVERHGARHLLLIAGDLSEGPGVAALKEELRGLGAEVEVAVCDIADRKSLQGAFDSISAEHPVGAIIHCAAIRADGLIESLNGEQLDLVFAAKAQAAWNLHELSAGSDLSAFVLFSSVTGTLGAAGQAGYAAANAFLDTLAQQRRAHGRPAISIAWGLWEHQGDKSSGLGEADLARLRRQGIEAFSDQDGLALLDRALEADRANVIALRLGLAGLRALASSGDLAPIFSRLVRAPKRRSVAAGSLGAKLATLSEAEATSLALDLVRSEVAAVLGYSSGQEVESGKAFKDLGFDSLTAVELRNRLSAVAGLRLRATVVFDYPNPIALAEHLLAEATASGGATQVAVRAQASEEPIAIIGMACRYPGGVDSPHELWQLVAEGRDAITEFPADRGWDVEGLYNPDPESAGTTYSREGGFLADAGEFDPEFFSIGPREALFMDPQERLLLESSWEALEDARLDPASLRKTQTGVFAGVTYQDYGPFPVMSSSVISGRISYALGLEGPAITVNTACSSSLVAMHLASQALRQGECNLALAGGVTVISSPGVFVDISRQRGLAPDGRCKSFAEAADGAGFSDGVGTVVLERLSDAQRNGHTVLALLKGSAVNQDGASNGLTAPNGPSQERVIRQALANARLEAKDVDAVEAHGTGTKLGDPIEAGALLATYGQERDKPLKLGSLKSNIGHTQAAAGVGGVIKMALAMREGVLPKTLHVDAPSSKIDWEAGEIELLSEQAEWETNGHPRRAGVSSFGISGTNAHVILEQAPEPDTAGDEAEEATRSLEGPIPLALSAKTDSALPQVAGRLAAHLEAIPDLDPRDVAFSLATTRSAFEHRAVVLGDDRGELLKTLDALARGEDSSDIVRGVARSERRPVFLYPGQGSQWEGMALDLLETSPAFAARFGECEEALAPHIDWSVKDVLAGAEGTPSIKQIEVVQPTLFAVMASLTELWRSHGVRPAAVAGHSQGEIVAAYAAGGLTLEDAAMLAALRSRIISKLAGKGGMASVALSVAELDSRLEPWAERIEIAAHNGPSSTILSGDREALDRFLEQCAKDGTHAREIPAAIASHSAYVEELREEVLETLAPISPRSGEIPFHSTVTGGELDTAELDAAYWYRNLRETVRFEQVTRGLLEDGHRVFIEVSPHPVFALAVGETIEATLPDTVEASAVGTLRRDEEGPRRFALSLAQAHAAGAAVDWGAYFAGSGAQTVKLPTYPFQRERYWLN